MPGFWEEPHLSRHPFAKIPAFEHDGFQLYETQAILRYIDEGFPVAPLQSTDLHQFSRMNQIMGIVDAYAWPSIAAGILVNREIGRAHVELQSQSNLVCRLLLEK